MQSFSLIPLTVFENDNNNKMMKSKNELLILISVVIYPNLTILLVDVHIDSGYILGIVVTKDGSKKIYGLDGAGPAPSLYTKYYRAW